MRPPQHPEVVGAVAVGVRVRVTSRRLAGPFVRRLAPLTDFIDHEEGP